MKTAVIYARYSSDKQTEQSIEGQLRVCNEYARNHDILIVDKYVDRAMTGTNDRRDEFQKMIKDSAKAKWDYVLVYKLDRFSRDKYETAIHRRTLRNNGVKLVSAMENIPDSPEGIILESLLEGMNQYFSAELSQKVRRGMRESRSKGNYTGGPIPLGYKVEGKKILIDEDDAEIVRHIYEEYARGKLPFTIMRELNNKGIQNKGRPFGKSNMQRILSNEKYIGIVRCGGEVYTNIYPPILDKHLFEYVRNKVLNNRYGRHLEDVVYLLRERLVCGYCGKQVQSSSGTSRSGKPVRYYRCAGRSGLTASNLPCTLKTIRKEVIEEAVVSVIEESLSKDLIDFVAERIMKTHIARTEDQSVLNLLRKNMDSVNRSIDNIVEAIENGMVSKSTRERLMNLEEKKQELEEKIAFEEAQEKLQLTKNDIKKYFLKALRKEPLHMIETLVKKVILYDDKIEIMLNYQECYGEERGEPEEVYATTKTFTSKAQGLTHDEANKTYSIKVNV